MPLENGHLRPSTNSGTIHWGRISHHPATRVQLAFLRIAKVSTQDGTVISSLKPYRRPRSLLYHGDLMQRSTNRQPRTFIPPRFWFQRAAFHAQPPCGGSSHAILRVYINTRAKPHPDLVVSRCISREQTYAVRPHSAEGAAGERDARSLY